MDKAITIAVDKKSVTVNIPNKIVIDVFKDYYGHDLKLKDKEKLIDDFAAALQEKIADDDFINDILDSFVCDVDYIEEVE